MPTATVGLRNNIKYCCFCFVSLIFLLVVLFVFFLREPNFMLGLKILSKIAYEQIKRVSLPSLTLPKNHPRPRPITGARNSVFNDFVFLAGLNHDKFKWSR